MKQNNESLTPMLERAGSPERFGHSWQMFSRILPAHEEQFLRWTTGIGNAAWKGATFLDVGCGIGRNSYWPLTYGAKSCLAIDLDPRTLAAARANLGGFENARVEERSAYSINETDRFDIVFSIGVIHHLLEPERAVAQMVAAAKPGGKVLVWLYGHEGNETLIRYFNPLRKALFSRLPLPWVNLLSFPATALLWVLLKSGAGRSAYLNLLRTFSFPHLRAIVYDHMIPRIARYYTRDEAEALLGNAGLQDIDIHHVNEMSWTVIGRKPS